MAEYYYKPEKVVKEGDSVFTERESFEIKLNLLISRLKQMEQQIQESNKTINELIDRLGKINGED